MLQQPGRAVDLPAANRQGQQLFLANMQFQRHKQPRLKPEPRWTRLERSRLRPASWRQLRLFDMQPDPVLVKQRALAADKELVQYCVTIVYDHAEQHGWSKRQTNDVIRSLRLLQVLQDVPGGKIKATDVLQLPAYDGNVNSTLEVLATAGLLIDDRTSVVERYFATKTTGLPEPMTAQLRTWLDVMLDGSRQPPRRHPRDPQTAKLLTLALAPILHAWAAQGHQSLASISRGDVDAALPGAGASRAFAEQALRSLFTVLKGRKQIFADPTSGMQRTRPNANIPLPLDTEPIRNALDSPDPATALAVALVAFHALTTKQVRELLLTDIVDSRLTLGGRTIPLAGPVVVRLTAYLDHRTGTWPASVNPYLFINRRTGPRTTPPSRAFPWQRLVKISPRALRQDRILEEIHATGGDVRRICDLFGITVETALRYQVIIEHPDLANNDDRVPRTRHAK